MMTPEMRELLAALRQVNQEIPALALDLMENTLPVAKQLAFADVLEAAGAALRQHAREQRPYVVEGRAAVELEARTDADGENDTHDADDSVANPRSGGAPEPPHQD